MPNVGWSNAIPDAVSEVHLLVNDTKIDFTGVGYHDSTSSTLSRPEMLTKAQKIGAINLSQKQWAAGSGVMASLAIIQSFGMTHSRLQVPSMSAPMWLKTEKS